MSKIEKYYSELFDGFEYETSGSFWRRLKWRLFWIDFRYFILGGAAASIIGVSLFLGTVTPGFRAQSAGYFPMMQTVNYHSTVVQVPAVNEQRPKNASFGIKGNEATVPATKVVSPPLSIQTVIDKKPLQFATTKVSEPENTAVTYSEFESKSNIDRETSVLTFNTLGINNAEINKARPELIYDSINKLYIPNRKVNFAISLYVSPAFNQQSLQTNSGYHEYLNYRTEHEKPAVSLSGGIAIQVNIKNWYIQSGLAYSKFTVNRNYNHTFLAFDSIRSYYQVDTTWGWYYDPPDIAKPVPIAIDSVFVPVYNDINEGRNEYGYLEIPLLAGYKLNRGRFSFDVAAGVSYGVLISTHGNVPSVSEKNAFTDLSNESNIIHQDQFNYILQLGVSYHITPDWSIMAKPFYKQNIRSVFQGNYPVDQRFSSFGVNFGLTVDL